MTAPTELPSWGMVTLFGTGHLSLCVKVYFELIFEADDVEEEITACWG